jgi:hypothetical protein
MGCVSAEQASQADDRVIFCGFGERACGRGDFKRAGYADNVDSIFSRAGSYESVITTAQQTISDEFIEARNNDPETKACGIELSRKRLPPNLLSGRVLSVFVSMW